MNFNEHIHSVVMNMHFIYPQEYLKELTVTIYEHTKFDKETVLWLSLNVLYFNGKSKNHFLLSF